jgi:hypothetical protein
VAGFNLIRNDVQKNQEQMRDYLRRTELDSEAFQDTRLFTYTNIFTCLKMKISVRPEFTEQP